MKTIKRMDPSQLNDPIEKIFEEVKGNTDDNTLELFKDDKTGDIALKTDLIHIEHVLTSCLATENLLIKGILDFDLYGEFLDQFRRHKVSLDRLSRKEFVEVNQKNTMDRDLERVSSLKNLTDSRT